MVKKRENAFEVGEKKKKHTSQLSKMTAAGLSALKQSGLYPNEENDDNVELPSEVHEPVIEETNKEKYIEKEKSFVIKSKKNNKEENKEIILNTEDVFSLKKIYKPKILNRTYSINKATSDKLSEVANRKGESKNSICIKLIKIGIDEILSNINQNMTIQSYIGRVKKTNLLIRIPKEYDDALEKHKVKLEKENKYEIKISKSEILNIMFDQLLKRFDF